MFLLNKLSLRYGYSIEYLEQIPPFELDIVLAAINKHIESKQQLLDM